MLLSELKEYLAYGELSQLHVGTLFTDGTEIERLVSHVNLGVTELYKRFPIRISRVNIALFSDVFEYTLHSSKSFRVPATDLISSTHYLVDSDAVPFIDNLTTITAIYDSLGVEIRLNDILDSNSILTVGHNVIKHPAPVTGEQITVEYKSIAPKLPLNSLGTVNIDIPPQFTEALLNYVTYRTFAAINMNSAESVNYYAKFEASCALINTLGMAHANSNTNLKLENSGWV